MQQQQTFISKAHAPKINQQTGRKSIPKWFYGKESRFYLVSIQNGQFGSKHYSHAVRSQHRPAEGNNLRTEEETIQFLQKLHQKGGTKNNKCGPGLDQAAFIIRNGCTIQTGLVWAWNPQMGWHRPQQFRSGKSTGVRWKLWTLGESVAQSKTIVGDPKSHDFAAFADNFIAEKINIASRYIDIETGEVNPDFLMCAWLAFVAHTRRGSTKRAKLYFQKSQTSLDVDLRNGVVTEPGRGGAWVRPEFFINLI
jgi:hypothetical protein